jgi:hypothetical protein
MPPNDEENKKIEKKNSIKQETLKTGLPDFESHEHSYKNFFKNKSD